MRSSWRLWSVLLLFATGCTYNPVRYDPATGFQTGGGVGVMCGGPLDPWMQHCCPQSGCFGPCDCLSALLCGRGCPSACPPACPTPVCPPAYPTPICPPACPTPVCPPTYPSPGIPLGSGVSPYTPLPTLPGGSPVLSAPMAAPPAYGAPTPTFAEPCATCASSSGSAYYPPNVQGMLPGTTNYPQLFNSPPMAPPAPAPSDPFMMPTPMNEHEMPPAADKMPPHYDDMETPDSGQAAPQNAAPMNQNTPMPMVTPRKAPEQNPMPTPANANQSSFRQVIPSSISHQGVVQPALKHYDSRRQQWMPIRL